MCADFQFYLNRQGARGPQGYKGDKGDDGKTPVPRTGTNTPIETTVIFDTGDGNPYETPNLKYPIEDRGGNVVMLDRTSSTQYYGTPDQATDNSYGIVKLATPESILDDPLDNDVVTYELFDDNNQAIKTVTDGLAGDITQLNTDLGTEVTNRTNADTQLTNKINTDVGNEATARSNADTALSGRIDSLTTSKANKSDVYTKTQTDSLLNNKSNVGHTHNYNEITNKPDIGNGTITFKQGNTTIGIITTNQLSNSTLTFADPTGITPGTGLDLNSSTNTLSVKIDNNTLGINSNGEIEVQNAGTTYSEGDAIDLTNDTISVKYDNSTLKLNGSGELYADIPTVNDATITITQGGVTKGTFTTNQSINGIIALDGIPDLSSYALNSDFGDMFSLSTTISKDVAADLDIANYGLITPYTYGDDYYYLNTNGQTIASKQTLGAMNDEISPSVIPLNATYDSGRWTVTEYIDESDNYTPENWAFNSIGIKELFEAGYKIYYASFSYILVLKEVLNEYTNYYDNRKYFKGKWLKFEAFYDDIPLTSNKIIWGQSATVQFYNFYLPNGTTAGYIGYLDNASAKYDLEHVEATITPTYKWNNDRFVEYANLGSGLSLDSISKTLSAKVDNNTMSINSSGELVANIPTLATVATSGSYNDLINKPTIPSTTNMVTTDTRQNITGVKTFNDNSGRYMSWSSGNLEVFGHDQEIINIHAINSSSAYIEIYKDGHYLNIGQRNSTPVILTYNKEKIYRGTNYNNTPTDFLLEKDMLDGTTIQYNTSTDKIEVIGGGSTGDYIEQTAPVTPLEYQDEEHAGSYTTTDVTQDSSNKHKYTPTSTNGEIKISYEQPASYTYLKTGDLKFKTNSETPYNGTIITCNTYRTFLPILIFDTGDIICRVPEANQTSSNSYHDINLGTTELNTEYTFSVEFISGVWNVNFNGNTYTYDTQANAITFDTSYSSNMYNSIKFGGSPSRIAWVDISNYVFKINSTTIYADTDSKLLLNYDNDVLTINSSNKLTLSNTYKVLKKTFDINKFKINGTPTISIDGIAANFNSTNNLKTIQCSDLNGHSWKIRQRFYYDSLRTGTSCIINQSGTWQAWGSIIIAPSPTRLVFSAKTGDSSESSAEGAKITLSNILSNSGYYIVENEFDISTGIYKLSLFNDNNVLLGTGDWTATTTEKQLYNIALNSSNYVRLGYGSDLTGDPIPLDLKESYIYKDGNEIFNGNKSDITVLVNRNIDSTGYVECWSDNVLEQGGTCIADTPVTFTEPFVDNNYILTIPYSSKSNTGFTPSATGDWIAKGLIRAQTQVSSLSSNIQSLNLLNNLSTMDLQDGLTIQPIDNNNEEVI